jgi:glutamate N-acetyltransferase/amino-acid N-acetyltransferase
VLIGQTGLIGIPFPLDATIGALPSILDTLSDDVEAGTRAARAIMTTDTFDKQAVVVGSNFTVGAMAKGAAMLAPNMATMLCCITTDAAVDGDDLQRVLGRAVDQSFNRLLTDGAMSTNDTVLLLASGEAGHVDLHEFEAAVTSVCLDVAEKMAEDAEGATKVIHLIVRGAASDEEAHRAARNVANSLLVKCSFNGEDPYWGRVVSELATAGVAFDIDRVSVAYGGVVVAEAGVAKPHDHAAVRAHLAQRHVTLECNLNVGIGAATMLTADLGHGYIDENRTTS